MWKKIGSLLCFAACLMTVQVALAAPNSEPTTNEQELSTPPLQKKEIRGKVVDSNGNPIIGAAVILKGTSVGASTDYEGKFSLVIPAPTADDAIEINYLGYEPYVAAIGARTHIEATLLESSIQVDNVVVTALGIKRSEKALSYNAQQVAGEAILSNKDINFINALNGKVAGVNINASSSGPGGATKVIMRGTKSIEQSSNALYVIDGVPMFTTPRDGGMEFSSVGSSDPIADLNPEDIESMSVLTGAAAAALYGSDAANGAIVITTKKGKAGHTSITVSSNTEISSPFVLPEFQNRYGTGDLNSSEGSASRSWGRRLNSANYGGYDPRNDWFQLGITGTESVSLATGTEKNQFYFSASAVNSRGIQPNNGYDRYNFTFRNTTSLFKDKVTLDVGASYIMQKDLNMTNQGTYSNPIVGAYLFPRGNDWSDIQAYERYDSSRKIYTQYWPVGSGGTLTMQNPYWVNYRNLRENSKKRYMANIGVTYKILDWLNVSGRLRIDNSTNDYTEKFYASTNTQLTELMDRGLYGITVMRDEQVYGDALININKRFGDDWSLQVNAGGSFSDMRSFANKTRGPIADGSIAGEKPGVANVFNVMNLSNTKTQRLQEGWREQTQSVFALAEIGYKGAYYLTVTGRNDWPSQLAGPNSSKSSFFYPSVGASVVLSEIIPNMPEKLSYVKVRASYASVGVAFARFLANPKYGWNASGMSWNTKTQYPLSNLKPERTNSFEVGVTMRFLKRFNFDISYYNTKTANQTFDPQVSTGSGASKIYIQSGDVLNEGVELMLGYKNNWGKFSWNSNYTFSTNRNEILSLAADAYNPITGEKLSIDMLNLKALGTARYILKEGGTLGDLYSQVDLRRDSDGDILIDNAGNLTTQKIDDAGAYIKLGSVLPKANMSWSNDFGIGNFNIGLLVTARFGGVVFSRTQAVMDYYGVSEATAAARDAGGVMLNGGDLVDANKWYTAISSGDAIPQYYTYSATNIRLQEASVSYTIPRKRLGDICEITLSLVGRNLLMLYKKAPFDPESIATTGNYYQGIDYFMTPSMRNFGFNLRLKF